MDKILLNKYLNLTNYNKLAGLFFYYSSYLSKYLFLLVYMVATVYLFIISSPKLGYFIVAPFFCLITNISARQIIKRKRPYIKYQIKMNSKIKKKNDYSFPSNHAASSMVIAFAFSFINIYIGIILFILSIITGISRAFLGIHYTSDILVGWGIGLFFGLMGYVIIYFF